jgi:hypothetical protein
MSLGSTEAVKRAVIAGVGLAFVSRLALDLELQTDALQIVPLPDLSIQRPLHRLRLRGKYESRATREFVRLLRQSKSDLAQSLARRATNRRTPHRGRAVGLQHVIRCGRVFGRIAVRDEAFHFHLPRCR